MTPIDDSSQLRDRIRALPDHELPRLFTDMPPPPRPARSRGLYAFLRRAFDIVVSTVALALFGLFLPLIALAIRIDSRGPVFYTQSRIGQNRRRHEHDTAGPERRKVIYPGRPFRIYKLRTMRIDAEKDGPQLAAAGDSRITRVGRLLRLSRIDEVPQFVNVLLGSMTLIGPRPERLCFVRQYERDIPDYCDRLAAQPGITGLAQVNNGYDEDMRSVRRKLMFDRFYIRKGGWKLDLRILISTVRVVLTGEGAR
ncbi:sugar transferase [bacterium]|nr:sugar transferase [bacterium]